ncbi:MAG: hypothetical protein HY815_28640, partial [Candidatus Riflebacteria bacterium]|nr:hypothetical protein [Candidatus Riflebacteria bacterium]
KPRSVSLVTRVARGNQSLRDALDRLDQALSTRRSRNILRELEATVDQCRRIRPELEARLKQHVTVLATAADVDNRRLDDVRGGPAIKNAYYWRLAACYRERHNLIGSALLAWEEFRRHGIHEGWFPEKSDLVVELYLRMAKQLRRFPPEQVDEIQTLIVREPPNVMAVYDGQPEAVRKVGSTGPKPGTVPYYLCPEELYERACALDPDPAVFSQWLQWERLRDSGSKAVDEVARAWHEARPEDSRPLLLLMESAEQRGALNKALRFLERAESIDSLSPDVRRARLRLLVASALRHLKNRKPHLLEKDLAGIEALPQAREGDRPAFWTACRRLAALQRGDPDAADRCGTELIGLVGGELPAIVVMQSLEKACVMERLSLPRGAGESMGLEVDDLPLAVARGCAVVRDLGVDALIPVEWVARLVAACEERHPKLDALRLRTLADAALESRHRELACAASGAGLALGGQTLGRFLLLRARSLDPREFTRRYGCLVAAAAFARRYRDMPLVQEAIEELQGQGGSRAGRSSFGLRIDESDLAMSQEDLDQVVNLELGSTVDSEASGRRGARSRVKHRCNCPRCRQTADRGSVQGRLFADDDEDPDEDDLDDEDDDDDPDDVVELPVDFRFPWDDGVQVDLLEIQAVIPLMMEAMARCGSGEPEVIARKAPDLYARISETIRRYVERQGRNAPRTGGRRRGGRSSSR